MRRIVGAYDLPDFPRFHVWDCMVVNMDSPTSRDEAVTVANEIDAQLLAVEFETLPFNVRRVFVVSSHGNSVKRGNHVAGCNQMLILLCGSVSIDLTRVGEEVTNIHLQEVGSSVLIQPGDFVTYELLDQNSQILVLADQTYADSFANRGRI
jgi:hypothetical protein